MMSGLEAKPARAIKRVLFLGFDRSRTRLIDALIAKGCAVVHTEAPIDGSGNHDLLVSFGYRHVLRKEVFEKAGCPILNLHIAYLPYNRGAHPNFWSFYENTPSGVTIHLMDEGIDTGPIVYQRYVNFDGNEKTFADTYQRLVVEIEALFIENIEEIIHARWKAKEQRGSGTMHYLHDLPPDFSGWNAVIEDELVRLDRYFDRCSNVPKP